jgi:glycosyltransferase involved in cell wall biosynthesis
MKKINILYVCRLFNGLETSMDKKVWSPTGVPTIYRMIERLDSDNLYNLNLIITSKNNNDAQKSGLISRVRVDGLSSMVTILHSFESKFGKLSTISQELFHFSYLFIKILFGRYSLLYIDHANIFFASIAARISKTPVVFRVMGVYPAMRSVMSGKKLAHKFLRWCYKSPFSMVICTQDGSGIEPWLDKALNKNTPVFKLINGVDHNKNINYKNDLLYDSYLIPRDKFLVLYLGKLEKIKGIYDFIEGFFLANKKCNNALHAIIIGCGIEYDNVLTLLHGHSQSSSVTLIERVSHNKIFQFHEISDIYISPNRLANLTNANLEAMTSGDCIVFAMSQSDTSVDTITDKLLDDSAVYRIKFPPTPNRIEKAIVKLFYSPELRSTLSLNVSDQSSKFIGTWSERINKELKLIDTLVEHSNKQ